MIKRCGLLFFAVAIYCNCAQAEEEFSLEPIVVTKSNIHLLNRYSLNYRDIINSSSSTPVESLSSLPLDLESRSLRGGIQTDFSLRGSTFQDVLMLVNGQRINDPQTAHHNSDIPLTKEDIETIEVTPGVSSSVFGPDAIGGAINFLLKKPTENKRVLELRGGEYYSWLGLFSISEKMDNVGVRVSAQNQASSGFHTDTDYKNFTASFNTSVDFPDGDFMLNFGYQDKEFGAYDFYTPNSGYQSKEYTRTFLVNSSIKYEIDGFVLRPNISWRKHFDKFVLDKTQVRSTYVNHHRTDMLTPVLYMQKEIYFIGKAGLGLEYGGENINSTNLGKHIRLHKSIFVDDAKDITDKLSLGLAFRWDDYDVFRQVHTGSVNLRFRLQEKSSLHFGVSRSMRIPSFTELYYNDPTTLGNANLGAEKSVSYDVGYEYKTPEFSLGVSVFSRSEKDFIDWVKFNPSQVKWQAENITASQVLGMESSLKLKLNDYLGLDCNYTYINKLTKEQGLIYKYGKIYCRHLVNSNFVINLPFGEQSVGFTYKKKPVRRGWFLLNTHFSFDFKAPMQIFCNITNLLNVEYQEIEGIPSSGRYIESGIRFQW